MSSPVKALTTKGKFLLMLLRIGFSALEIFNRKKWIHPIPGFHEDPLEMSKADVLFLGYKYYHKKLENPEPGSGTVEHFRSQDIRFGQTDKDQLQSEISISFGGDLMPYKLINKESAKYIWDETGDWFFNSDIVFANLETPVDLSRPASLVPEVMLNDMHFNCSEEMFKIFNAEGKFKGFDVLSTANNHSMDMGEQGLLATIGYLKKKGIQYSGTALNENDLNNFPIIEKKGIKTAFLSYTYSLNKFLAPEGKEWMVNHIKLNKAGTDISLLIKQVKLAREKGADLIVLSLHMGCAYQAWPSKHIIEMYHRIFIESGADVIIGGHPHNPQPMEIFKYQDLEGNHRCGFAVYSLGDFVAYDIYTWCHLPLMLKLFIQKNKAGKTFISNIELLPVYNEARKVKDKWELRFRDILSFQRDPEKFNDLDNAGKAEVKELLRFLDLYLLPEKKRDFLKNLDS